MNLQSIILLALVVAVFLIVGYRYVKAQKKNPGCGSCNCSCGSSACDGCVR